MKWQSIVAGALASVFGALFIAGTASADVRIVNDPGGEVSSYLRTFYEVRATGERIVIDGPCRMQKCSVVVYLALCFRQAGVIEPMCQLTEKAWRYSPRSAAPHRGASAGINTAVLLQKRLGPLTVGFPLFDSDQRLTSFMSL